jgi:hypothetical protein
MNWMKKGPELKLSEIKVPDFLHDLYSDLKERHLLPLVALLIVAMVAAPIYFKDSTKSVPEVATIPAIGSGATAGEETLAVAKSEPGLRDYRRRLRRAHAIDPFRGQGEEASASPEVTSSAAPSPEPAAPTEATVVGGESSGPEESPESSPAKPSGAATESGSAGSGETRTRYASDSIDVRIVAVPHHSTEEKKVKRAKPQAEVRRNLPELTMLPARETPAATFMGLSSDGKKALFLVSSDVVAVFGEGQCVIGSQTCQLLALEPGLPETFVYGPDERTYRIELLKIEQSYAARPRRATLGATKPKGKSQTGSTGNTGGETPAPRG